MLKFFRFTVNIIDKNGKLVENSNKIPLTLSIYTCENPPKYIDSNTAGNLIQSIKKLISY